MTLGLTLACKEIKTIGYPLTLVWRCPYQVLQTPYLVQQTLDNSRGTRPRSLCEKTLSCLDSSPTIVR